MDIRRIINNKPPLFHYTRDDTILSILSNKYIWARPTWNFADTGEYVHGLWLIERFLKRISSSRQEAPAMPAPGLELMASYDIDPRRLVEQTIAHIEYELANPNNPKVEVYVACMSTNSNSKEMASQYGGFVIRFNWMLPLLAYACPRPFTASLLSRVTYDEREFESHIMTQGFTFGLPADDPGVSALLVPMNTTEREASVAATAAVQLSVFAANIKKPKYAYEREWRLKTVRSMHSIPTLFSLDESINLRKDFRMSEDAAFTTHTPSRYIQDLRCHGKMIIENVAALASGPVDRFVELLRQVQEHTRADCLGPALNLREALLRK
jgi:hypothetical protein